MIGFSNILRGISGEFELLRTCGAFSIVVFTLSAPAFEAWNMIDGRPFDVTAFCLAFSGGLVAVVGGVAGAVSLKDRNIATATVVRETGSQPGGPTPGVQDVNVVNTKAEPANVKESK